MGGLGNALDGKDLSKLKNGFAELIREHPGIGNEFLNYCCTPWNRYLYGDGEQAAVCLSFFRDMGVDVEGILIPPGYKGSRLVAWWGRMLDTIPRISITGLTDEERMNSAVLMAIPREAYPEASEFLKGLGFWNIYGCCWEHNQYLRDICVNHAKRGKE